jgi:hypothetical protein
MGRAVSTRDILTTRRMWVDGNRGDGDESARFYTDFDHDYPTLEPVSHLNRLFTLRIIYLTIRQSVVNTSITNLPETDAWGSKLTIFGQEGSVYVER